MISNDSHFEVRLATDARDKEAAQRLRYQVFVAELGGDGAMVDHEKRLERDAFDADCDHLVVIDTRRDAGAREHVVGVYRLLPGDRAARIGRFYTESEYDLSVLKASGRRLLELGRSCVHADYRGGSAMFHLWRALAGYVRENHIEVLFGVASFHGTDITALRLPLANLHHFHLAPPVMRVRARAEHFQPMDLLPAEDIDRREALVHTPTLIKAYLRMGGFVGEGAFIDNAFNTIDVCLLMDTTLMSKRHRRFYSRDEGGT